MRLLLVETTAYAPASPLFLQACAAKAIADASFAYRLFDEAPYSMTWTFAHALTSEVQGWQPDVILFVGGQLVTRTLLERLHATTKARLVCWQPDDPWNPKACAARVLECVPFYDVYLTCKTALMDPLVEAGAQRVVYLPCGYKPQIHFTEPDQIDPNFAPFRCDLSVIGGADEERLAIVKEIHRTFPDLTINLYGGYWDRDRELRPLAKGIVSRWQYRAAIRCATICLNLLRTDNSDQHNMKTFEIPACGGLMVTKDTPEHNEIFGKSTPIYYDESQALHEVIGEARTLTISSRQSIIRRTASAIKNATWSARLEQLCAVLSSSSVKTATSPPTT